MELEFAWMLFGIGVGVVIIAVAAIGLRP